MAAPSPELVLELDRVTVTFDDVIALNDVSFRVRAGRTFIVFGAAGSGKSVMLKTAVGLVRPDRGTVRLFGDEVTGLKEAALFPIRSKVGILFQESGLFDSLTIAENVGYPLVNQQTGRRRGQMDPSEVDRRVRESLRFVELEHTLDKFPSELSGGMRRRVGIARASVTEPPLMLYDSPTAGLDPITANTIVALIVKARDTRNTTSLIVTHRYQDGEIIANFRWNSEQNRLEPLEASDSVHDSTTFLVMQEGGIAFEGSEEELNASTDPYVSKFKKPRP
jgi:phospholipid/cholesterol/gamma-HCH transport system ATP-binding protein